MANVTLNVNGRMQTVDVEPSTPLLYVLRNDLDLQGPRFGCGLGQCGACTVLINGTATRSCVTPVSSVKGPITTLEGLARNGALHPVQQAWIDEQVPACGYCQNGQMLTAVALLQRNPRPDRRADPRGDGAGALPLLHLLPDSSGRSQSGFCAAQQRKASLRNCRRTAHEPHRRPPRAALAALRAASS